MNVAAPENLRLRIRGRLVRLGGGKPLVVLAPKTLLRLPAAVSPLADFGPGKRFEPVLASGPFAPTTELTFDEPVEGDSFVLWITEVPDSAGKTRLELDEILVQ